MEKGALPSERGFLDKAVDVIFAKDKTLIYLIILTVIGFILRIIAASHIEVLADDMHFAPGAINFISSGKLIYWDQSAGLWFATTDIFYKLFGISQISSRLASILFGTLLIPLIFLLTKELFKNNKAALIASVLVTFSNFNLKIMMAEMDIMAMFFVLFSIFIFLKAINSNYSKKLFLLSGILMGLAVYTKVYPLLFIPGMIVFLLYKAYKDGKTKDKWNMLKIILIFGIAAFVFCLPAITHNYLLNKDKGIMDHQFTKIFGNESQKQMYSWVSGYDAKVDIMGFLFGRPDGSYYGWPTSVYMLWAVYLADPLVVILGALGVLGLLFLWKKREETLFLFLIGALPFIYLASVQLLTKHYIFVALLLALPAAYFISEVHDKIQSKFKFLRLRYIIILIIIFSLIYAGKSYTNFSIYQKSATSELMAFKEKSIGPDSLVIVDGRVYRGRVAWMFSDRHYLEANYIDQLFSFSENRSRTPITVYFVECTFDDCGWGTIKDQPDFNKSSEEIVSYFKNISSKEVSINELDPNSLFRKSNSEYYTVYKTTLNLAPESLALADSTHNWWLYPIGYDKKIAPVFDDYEVNSTADSMLNSLAHLIRLIAIVLVFISILIFVYFLIKNL